MSFEEWILKHQTNRVIDVKSNFDDNEIALLNKLKIVIKDELYTGNEFEFFMYEVGAYNKEPDMSDEELEYYKSLEDTGVSMEEYKKLLEKVDTIFRKYENLFICN